MRDLSGSPKFPSVVSQIGNTPPFGKALPPLSTWVSTIEYSVLSSAIWFETLENLPVALQDNYFN